MALVCNRCYTPIAWQLSRIFFPLKICFLPSRERTSCARQSAPFDAKFRFSYERADTPKPLMKILSNHLPGHAAPNGGG